MLGLEFLNTARNILESENCVLASISFAGKHVKHIKEQGEVMTAGNRMSERERWGNRCCCNK